MDESTAESPDAGLTHLDAEGRARMVDVTGKDRTRRVAVARGRLRMREETLARLERGEVEKGDALQVARIAGMQAGKRTGELIPLCHVLPGASLAVELTLDRELPGVVVEAEARYAGRTGVEMEALTAVSVALLTLYDMLKAVDRGMVLEDVRLLKKSGGASGTWTAPQLPEAREPGTRGTSSR